MEWINETGGYKTRMKLGLGEGSWISITNGTSWDNIWITREMAASILAEAIEEWLHNEFQKI